jgi:hypothetical protein
LSKEKPVVRAAINDLKRRGIGLGIARRPAETIIKPSKTEPASYISVIYYSFTTVFIMSLSNPSYRALVFGASGITGWAISQEALKYPSPRTFDKVIGLTNRPLRKSEALLPEDGRLELYSGVDLSGGASEVEASLKRIDGIQGWTHVYFCGES